jgi:hypothetical protein
MLGQLHHCLRTGKVYDPAKAFPNTADSLTDAAAAAA